MNLFLGIIIVLLSSLLYWLGGQKNNWFRWGMGLVIPLFVLPYNIWNFILCGVTYFVSSNIFVYGEKSWLNFLGEKGKFALCGFVFGLASMPVLGLLSILSGIVGGFGFLILKILDDKDLVKNPYQELLRGAVGCVVYIFK